jgi:ADP-ribose pyrophosphatase YjhB (NUDIX family)
MVWKPNVTVAAVIERDGRFLLVEEETSKGLRFNQPAGHLEENESLIDAVKREVLEETAWVFEPQHLISSQIWRRSPTHTTFLRFCFAGICHSHNPNQLLDEGIVATHWLTYDEIKLQSVRLRSPLVLSSISDYLSGQRYPLTLLQTFLDHG